LAALSAKTRAERDTFREKVDQAKEPPRSDIFVLKKTDPQILDSWEFDAPSIKDLSEKYRLIWSMFNSMNYMETYSIDKATFAEFIFEVQRLYNIRSNPFHYFDHGVNGKLVSAYLIG
jgi:hypothetical protein